MSADTPPKYSNFDPTQDPRTLPWNHPGMVICEGRYYFGVFLMDIPRGNGFPFGGDLNGCLWHFNETPEDWVITYRVRYNAGENTSPWDYVDRKSWHVATMRGTEAEIGRKLKEWLELSSGFTGQFFHSGPPKVDWLYVRGDDRKFFREMQRQKKPWMHMKQMKLPKPTEP